MAANGRLGWLCAGVVALTTPACSSSSDGSAANAKTSCDVDTKAMKASLSIQARGASTEIYAAAFAEGNVALDCGDTFSATVGGQHLVLERAPNPDGGPVHYVAQLSSPAAATTATIALERPAPKVSAAVSKAYLPGPFAVRDPSATVKVAAGENVHFRMEPPLKIENADPKPDSVRLRLELEGSCLDGVQIFNWAKPTLVPPLVEANGMVTLVNTNKILKRKGTEAGCDVTMRIVTLTSGEVDPAFAGSLDGVGVEASRHDEMKFHLDW